MTNIPIPGPSTVTLRAHLGEPLRDEPTRGMVVATARAIAERTGVGIREIDTTPDSVVVTLEADHLAAVGFAAELRTLTTNWYRHKFGVDQLWGQTPHEHGTPDDDDAEEWQDGTTA